MSMSRFNIFTISIPLLSSMGLLKTYYDKNNFVTKQRKLKQQQKKDHAHN